MFISLSTAICAPCWSYINPISHANGQFLEEVLNQLVAGFFEHGVVRIGFASEPLGGICV